MGGVCAIVLHNTGLDTAWLLNGKPATNSARATVNVKGALGVDIGVRLVF